MVHSMPFIGRKSELNDLGLLLKKKTASLVVIQGRRRIGKSRLIQEFGKNQHFYPFSGFPPAPHTSEQEQRNEFMRQLVKLTGLPYMDVDDWSHLFLLLSKHLEDKQAIILFDEISWMGSKDPNFLGKLKNAWDLHFKMNPRLILIFCGSVSAWIEKNILGHTGFMGRVSLTLALNELTLSESNLFLDALGMGDSSFEKFKILAITGGIPRYLEEIQPSLTVEENIKRLCFTKKGFLFREFNDIFSDLFSKRSEIYKKIVGSLEEGSLEYNEICEKVGFPKSGHVSEYLDELIKSGFISRDYTWHLKSKKESRLSHYRLSDNYVRFYLKYIEKNKGKIERSHFEERALMNFPGWESIMGLQFENLVLNNRSALHKKLNIYPEEIVADNPFFQRKTTRIKGCQIDYLIHLKHNVLLACEMKFSRDKIGTKIIPEMERKLSALSLPTGFSVRPVLIHVNGVETSVIEHDFFSNIVDFSDFLEEV